LIVQAATPPSLEPSRRERYFDTVANVESGARGLERGFGLRNRYARPLYTLLGIAALILLIAAVNLGSLVFVRLDSSRHELAVRTAIGAGRARLVREVTLQGALLGGAGAAGGLFFASQASPALAAFLTRDFFVPTALDVSVGWLVIIAAAVVSVGRGISITAIAAWASTSPRLMTTLAGGNRSVTRSARVGRVLVGVQAALVIVLLTHAALLGRNIYNMSAAESGLTSETVLVGRPLPLVGMYRQLDATAYYRDALPRLRAVPGVAAAAFSEYRPQQGALYPERVNRAGTPNDGTDVMAETTLVSPGLFETLGMSVSRGRDFALSDSEGSRRVVIISQSLAMRLFGDSGGLGERIRIASRPETQNLEVVGIVSNARLFDVRKGNLAIAYLPALQMGGLAHFKVLLARAPESAARAIQHAIDSLGAETLPRVQTVEYARGRTLLQERVMAALGGYFGVLALLLMAAGMYGLLAYVLSLRRKEMGIRMALGADGRQLGRTMLGDGLRIGGIGLVCGLVAALSTVGVLERVLVATSPYDPMAIAVACAALLIVAAVAALIPAARASRVEPLDELRRE
jgi:predicted permease